MIACAGELAKINNPMHRLCFLIFIAFFYAFSLSNNSKSENWQDNSKQIMSDTTNKEYKLFARFNSFDTTVEVHFVDTQDSISYKQKKNYDDFLLKQNLLTPDILKKVFEFYLSAYADYKKGWTMTGSISDEELEKYLPTPTTPENLKQFITPAIIHIQSKKDCEEGTIGIEFDCTWDIKSGLGVLIKDWNVSEVSVAEIVYF